MAKSFRELRASRKNDLAKLTKTIGDMDSGGRSKDDRFWQPTVDKAGNGFARIRFLDRLEDEDSPFIRYYDHAFKGPGGMWYINNSRTSLGLNDPVSEMNRELWNKGEEGKKIVRGDDSDPKNRKPGTKRRLHYVTNILVLDDPENKQNEGKVFLYKFGVKIWDKIKDACDPEFKGQKPVNVFSYDEGANFVMKIRNVKGYRNYDMSQFEPPSPLGDDDFIDKIMAMQYPLKPFISEEFYKSYDDLKRRLDEVMEVGKTKRSDEHQEAQPDTTTRQAKPDRVAQADPKPEPGDEVGDADGSDFEGAEYFRELANG